MIKNRLMKKIAIFVCIVSMFTSIVSAETGFSAVEEVNSSIISLPINGVKGQVSVILKGKTVTNIPGSSGDFETDAGGGLGTGWTAPNAGTTSLQTDSPVFGSKYQRITGTTNPFQHISHDVTTQTGKFYFLSGYVKSNDATTMWTRLGADSPSEYTFASHSVGTTWSRIGRKIASDATTSFNKIQFYVSQGSINTFTLEVDGAMLIEITQDEYNNLSTEELFAKYNFVNDTKSTVSTRIKSVGKNLFDISRNDYTGLGVISITPTINAENISWDSGSEQRYAVQYKVKPNTSYVLSYTGDQVYSQISKHTAKENLPSRFADYRTGYVNGSSNSMTITTDSDTKYLIVHFSNSIDTSINKTITNVQLEEGNTETAYEPYQESISYIQLSNGEALRSLPNGVKDEVRDGKLYKRTEKSSTFKSATGWTVDAELTNTIRFHKPLSELSMDDAKADESFTLVIDGVVFPINIDTGSTDDEIAYINSTNLLVRINKSKLSTLNSAGVEGYLNGVASTLIYQLATEQITDIPTTPLIGYPNGTIIIEPAVSEGGVYDGNVTINNSDLPIESIESVKRINSDSTRTMIDLSNITIAADGKSFTITGAADGESYEYEYMYPQELTTIPTMSYSVPIDQNGQINGNTNMIQQNSELINLILQEIQLLRDEINTMQ